MPTFDIYFLGYTIKLCHITSNVYYTVSKNTPLVATFENCHILWLLLSSFLRSFYFAKFLMKFRLKNGHIYGALFILGSGERVSYIIKEQTFLLWTSLIKHSDLPIHLQIQLQCLKYRIKIYICIYHILLLTFGECSKWESQHLLCSNYYTYKCAF